MRRILLCLFMFLIAGGAQAAPLVQLRLEGRKQGSSDPFATSVSVSTGDTVEYRLQLQMAPIGTFNEHLNLTNTDQPGKHGMNSLSIDFVQNASDPIQVDFGSPGQLSPGWDRRVGADGGTPTDRNNESLHDLLAIRPIMEPGIFSGKMEEMIFSGAFDVAAVSGGWGQVNAEWGPWAGGGSFDGHVFFLIGPKSKEHAEHATENTLDPFAEFSPLRLIAASAPPVPEPSGIALVGVAVGTLFVIRRRLPR